MNKAEKVALIELGLTEEQLAERGAKVSAMLVSTAAHVPITSPDVEAASFDPYAGLERCENCEELKLDVKAGKDDVALCPECVKALTPKPRKPRSDKGKPKPPKPTPQATGVLTTAQVLEITRLYAAEMLAVDVSRQAQMEAVILAGKVEEAYNARCAYLETLAGK